MTGIVGIVASTGGVYVINPIDITTLDADDILTTVQCSVTFNTDGSLSNATNGGTNVVGTKWLSETGTNFGTSYYVRCNYNFTDNVPTITAQRNSSNFTQGTWYQVSSNQEFSFSTSSNGISSGTVTFGISGDAANEIATVTANLSITNG